MQTANVKTYAVSGTSATPLTVEVAIDSKGLPGFTVIGGMHAETACELREIVRCAIMSRGFTFPQGRITVHLSPAGIVRSSKTSLALPVAVGLLAASKQISPSLLETNAFWGELDLNGNLVPSRGTSVAAYAAQNSGRPLVAFDEPCHFMAVGIHDLSALRSALPAPSALDRADIPAYPDFSEIADGPLKRAAVIAAAGNHPLFVTEVADSPVTAAMVAARIPGILPDMTADESNEVLFAHCAAWDEKYECGRPFRSPHHSVTLGGLLGGGRTVAPGEVTLANKGVLFLDELQEYAPAYLKALRPVLDERVVRIVRSDRVYEMPADFLLVAAAKPCPCGHFGSPHTCYCSVNSIVRYQARVLGPLTDRFEIFASAPTQIGTRPTYRVSTADMKQEVDCARNWAIDHEVEMGEEAHEMLRSYVVRFGLGARESERVASVARTIACLSVSLQISPEHVTEAMSIARR